MVEVILKIAVLGESGVGKSSIIKQFTGKNPKRRCCSEHNPPPCSRIGCSTSTSKVHVSVNNGKFMESSFDKFKYSERCTCHRNIPVRTTLIESASAEELRLIHLSILEINNLTSFPKNSLEEWENEEIRGLCSCNVYLLVFDVNKPSSFSFVANIREKIIQVLSELTVGN